MTPAARTLTLRQREGWTAAVCERGLPRCLVPVDLFGLADVAAVRPGDLLLVQATGASNHSARVRKTLAAPALSLLLSVPGVAVEVRS